jgi:hypothetical protein
MGFSLPVEGSALTQPGIPAAPEGEGGRTGTAGVAVSLLFLVESAEATTPEIAGLVSADPLYDFPTYPSVTFYAYLGAGVDAAMVSAATLGATWERHEVAPGLWGLRVLFSNPGAKPLKKGETLAISVVG